VPRGPAPQWRARQPVMVQGAHVATAQEIDAYIMASVNGAGGLGKHHPTTGHYATLYIRGLKDREEAEAWSRALYRCAHFLNRHRIAEVSMSVKIVRLKPSGYEIKFTAIDKTIARAHVMAKYGTDRSKWPYDPRRKGM
jgi:hypothetical protein